MKANRITSVLIGIIIGGVVGYGGAVYLHTPKLNAYSRDYESILLDYTQLVQTHDLLITKYDALSEDHSKLSEDYSTLKTDRGNLQRQYEELYNELSSLSLDYEILSSNYDTTWSNLEDLSNDILDFYDLLYSYCSFPEAFPRVLNSDKLEKISSTVSSVTRDSKDHWLSCERIYEYIADDIEYVNDIEFPHIYGYTYSSERGKILVKDFSIDIRQNYIQTPEFTIEYEQGDCDDQAILAYAMIQHYRENILGKLYSLYLARIEFSGGTHHIAVFMPVADDHICIIDPAGHYLTSKYGRISSKDAPNELVKYSNHWADTSGEIVHVELYEISIEDGSHRIVSSGTLNEIIPIFSAD